MGESSSLSYEGSLPGLLFMLFPFPLICYSVVHCRQTDVQHEILPQTLSDEMMINPAYKLHPQASDWYIRWISTLIHVLSPKRTLNTTALAFHSAFLHFASNLCPCSPLLTARSSFESSVPCLTARVSEEDLRASGSPNTEWLSKCSDCYRLGSAIRLHVMSSLYLCMVALSHCGVMWCDVWPSWFVFAPFACSHPTLLSLWHKIFLPSCHKMRLCCLLIS